MLPLTKLLTFLLLLHGECRGESLQGQLAVSSVVFVRGIDSTTVDYKQFNCFADLKIKHQILNNNIEPVAREVWSTLTMNQIMLYSLIYLNRNLVLMTNDNSNYYMTKNAWKHVRNKYRKWSGSLKVNKTVGDHIFLEDKE